MARIACRNTAGKSEFLVHSDLSVKQNAGLPRFLRRQEEEKFQHQHEDGWRQVTFLPDS